MRPWMGLGAAAAVVIVGLAVAALTRAPLIELDAPERGEVVAEWLPDGTPVFVTRRGNEVSVVDARVPRWLGDGLEVHVSFCENSLDAWEPIYGSTFDRTGDWTDGPAPEGLATYEAELTGDRVRVGPRRPPAARPEEAGGGAVGHGPCSAEWTMPHGLGNSQRGVHHHEGAFEDAAAPEDLAASQTSDPTVVLGAVERVDPGTLRACHWEPSHIIEGPLCAEDAPEVEDAPFGFLAPGSPPVRGSYGLWLMTSEDGRLRVEGVLPEQVEYRDEPWAGPAPPPEADD